MSNLAAQPGQDATALEEKVAQILKCHRVAKYLLTNINKKISYTKVYERPGRPSPSTPSRRVRQTTLTLTYQRCSEAIPKGSASRRASFQALAGWRLYVTNASLARLSLEDAVHSGANNGNQNEGFIVSNGVVCPLYLFTFRMTKRFEA